MTPTMCAVFVTLALMSAIAVGSEVEVTPVQKVLTLLEGMLAKGKAEKSAEMMAFAEYKEWCDTTASAKNRDVEDENEQITVLSADIAKYQSHAMKLGKEIMAHDEEIRDWDGEMKAATATRHTEKADYDALYKDYSESIDALALAIDTMKAKQKDYAQKASLVQLSKLKSLSLIPEHAKKAIDLFMAQGLQSRESVEAPPEALGYEFQSNGIIEMLSKLQDKFLDERHSIEMKEKKAAHEYELLMQDLKAQSEDSAKDRTEGAEMKASDLEHVAQDESSKADVTKTMIADKKYLSGTMAACANKKIDFESRQKLRAEEIEALEAAIKIISSSSVSGAADKHLPALLFKGTALAQLRATKDAHIQQRAATFLNEQGKLFNSRLLEAIAAKAAADPFIKVKKMLGDLLTRLQEEAADEAQHKQWCDEELSTNAATRKEKSDEVEGLTVEKDELEALIAKLTEGIAESTKEAADLQKSMSQKEGMRVKEKAENEATIKDAREAEDAVASAIAVLKDFYAKAAEATSLVQQRQPEVFDSPYKGMQAESGGIVGMLEVIQTDFARLEADTTASETSAAKEYTDFMESAKSDIKAKERSIDRNTVKSQDTQRALILKKQDLEGAKKELDTSLAYFEKLKPSCLEAGVSYDDRTAKRKEEIQSLKQALEILTGPQD